MTPAIHIFYYTAPRALASQFTSPLPIQVVPLFGQTTLGIHFRPVRHWSFGLINSRIEQTTLGQLPCNARPHGGSSGWQTV